MPLQKINLWASLNLWEIKGARCLWRSRGNCLRQAPRRCHGDVRVTEPRWGSWSGIGGGGEGAGPRRALAIARHSWAAWCKPVGLGS